MTKIYKAAVIGCGGVGAEEWNFPKEIRPETHAASLNDHPRVDLAALVDMDEMKLKRAGKYFKGVPLFNSAGEMFKKIKPDIVSVASNSGSHAALVKMAASHKTKAILCEKPIAESIKQAEEMIKICKKNESLLFINHQRRFDPLFWQWRKNVKKGMLGKIIQANCYYYNGLFNSATHVVDLLRFFLGEADWVSGLLNRQTSWKKGDDNMEAMIKFKNGTMATLQTLPKNYGVSDYFFYGEKGYFAIKNLGYEVEYKKLAKNKYCKGFFQLSDNIKKQGKPRSLMEQVANHIISCLDGREKPVSRGEDGLAALKILFAIKKSAKNQGKIIKI